MPADPRESIRPARESDIPGLSELFREVFNAERSSDLWRWKLFQNPRGFASFVCEVEGRIVAHCAGVPVRFVDFEREYVALQSVDFMSSPTYPGGIGRGGVFVRTVEQFFRAYCGPSAIPMVYGFPGERHRVLGERLLGYRSVEPIFEWTLQPEGNEGVALPLSEAALSEFAAASMQFGAVRDLPYLRWRYLAHPSADYRIVGVKRFLGSGFAAAAIVRLLPEGAFVMELGGRLNANVLTKLASELAQFGRPVKVWASPAHPLGRLLQDSGFQKTQRDHLLECRFFFQREVPLPGEFYYTFGDYDVY